MNPSDPPENPYQAPNSSPEAPPRTGPDPGDDAISTVIPYRNAPALIAYYCGLFSLIPCLGLPLAITAVILGFKGLGLVKRNPQVKGTVHAWVGLVGAGIGFLINVPLVTLLVIGLIMELTGS
ncbi:hypothetical protein BH23PLA1_BH23PLA1_39680 [soil metagenome]